MKNSAKAEKLFQRGLILHKKGLLIEADYTYKQVLAIQPRHFDALHLSGLIASQTNNHLLAVDLISRAIEINPNSVTALYNIAIALQELKLLDKALINYEKALKINPDDDEIYYNRGNVLYELKQLDKALASYDKAIEINPKNAYAYYNRGSVLLKLNRPYEALHSCDLSIQIKPEFAEAYANRGSALLSLMQLEEALKSYEYAIVIKPNYSEAFSNKGYALHKMMRYEEALASYDMAISINPNYAEAYSNRCITLRELGRLEEALRSIEQALAINCKDAEAYTNRGNILLDLNLPHESIISYETAININPNFAEAYSNKGNALLNINRPEEALIECDLAIKFKPDYAEAYINSGNALIRLGRYEEALKNFERAIEIRPESAEAYSNCGYALQELMRPEEALMSYDKAIEIKHNYAEAYSNRGNVLLGLNRIEDALNCYNKAIEIKTDYAEAYWNKSLAQLSSGDFFNGWKNYEYRWKVNSSDKVKLAKDLPVFNINRKSEKTFIWREQGLGDEILFSMMYADVKHICQDYIIQAEPRLLEIFTRTYPEIKFLSSNQDVAVNDCKQHIPAGSLSQYLRNSIDKFRDHNLLVASESLVEHFRAKLITSKNKLCGFSWKSVSKKTGAAKSFSLEDLLPIFRIPDITFLNLQYGNVENEINDFKNKYGVNIINLTNVDHFNDIESHLSLINVCDFVLSASNTTAHFSGALGKKTFIIAPNSQGLLWYWNMKDLNDFNLWYPSLKVFKQEKIRDWSIPVLSAKKEIINFIYI